MTSTELSHTISQRWRSRLRARPSLVLIVASTASALTGISISIMSVTFPEIQRAFVETRPSTLSWVNSIFTIIGAATLVPMGVVADRLGRKRVMLAGVAVFFVGSILAALSQSAGQLIAARGVQAFGASAYTPAAAAIVFAVFPPERLPFAIGIWSVVGGVSSAIGPAFGGVIVEHGGWRWAFWVVVPLAAAVLVLGPMVFPESLGDGDRAWPDALGAVVLMASISLAVFGVVNSQRWHWASVRTLACIVGGAVLLVAVYVRSLHHRSPVIEPKLLRIGAVRWSNIGIFAFSVTWFGVFFGIVQFLTRIWGWKVARAGLYTSPVSLGAGLVGIAVGRVAGRLGYRRFILAGTCVYAASAAWFWWQIDTKPDTTVLLIGVVLLGLASGLVFPSFQAAALMKVPRERHAVGSGINFTVQRIGATIGVALEITFLTAENASPLHGWHQLLTLAIIGSVVSFAVGTRVDTRPDEDIDDRAPVDSRASI